MRRNVTHPDDTYLSPYDTTTIEEEPDTKHKRDLYMVAKRITTTEAQLKRHLSELGIPCSDDLLSVTISDNRPIGRHPIDTPTARRAKTAQRNLRSAYQQWDRLCKRQKEAIESTS